MTSLTLWYHVITVRWRHRSRARQAARHAEFVQRLRMSNWSHLRTSFVRLATCPSVNGSHWLLLYDSLRHKSRSGFRTDAPSGRSWTRDWTWTVRRLQCLSLVQCWRPLSSLQPQPARSYQRSVTLWGWQLCLRLVYSSTGSRTFVSTTTVYFNCSVQSRHHRRQQQQQRHYHQLTRRLHSTYTRTCRPSSDFLSVCLSVRTCATVVLCVHTVSHTLQRDCCMLVVFSLMYWSTCTCVCVT